MTSLTELCDHRDCPATAVVAYVRGYIELTFCRHHSRELKMVLTKDSWECVEAPEGKSR